MRVLNKAEKKLITRRQAAEELKLSSRQVRRPAMMAAGYGGRRNLEAVHEWRPRRSCRGELVQCDTIEQHGQASLFRTDRRPQTQIGRGLQELGIVWIAA